MYYLPTVIKGVFISICCVVFAAEGTAAVYSPGDIIASWGEGQGILISRFDPLTGSDTPLVSGGTMARDFEFDPSGNLVYTNQDGLHRLNRDTGVVTTVASGFGEPSGLAIAPDGTIYVGVLTGSEAHSIKKVHPISGIVLPVAVTGVDFGSGPFDLEVGPGGDLFAADLGTAGFGGLTQTIIRIDLGLGSASVVTSNNLLANGAVSSIEFDGMNNLVLGDTQGNVVVFDTASSTQTLLSSAYPGGFLGYPMEGLALDNAGDIIFANSGTGSLISVAATSGTQTRLWDRSNISSVNSVIVVPQVEATPEPTSLLVWSLLAATNLLRRLNP
jgi:streptogramin lyase